MQPIQRPFSDLVRQGALLICGVCLAIYIPAMASAAPPAQPRDGRLGGMTAAKTTLFGLPGNGSKFLYVLDTSESMTVPKGKPLASAKEEIIASIDKLDRLCEFYVIHYNNVPHVLDVTGGGRLSFGTDDNKIAAKRLIANIQTGPRTEHEPAIVMALRMRPDVIYLMTDGDDPELTARDLERISRINEASTVIHAIQFGQGEPKRGAEWLKRLAQENRGEYKFIDVNQAADAKH